MTVDFSDDELQALAGLLDAGVKATGLRSVKDAARILQKIEEAAARQPQNESGS